MLLSLAFSDPLVFAILAVTLVMSLSVHEWAHAITADRLGDSTPRRAGRVTLNPMSHLDPFGTLLLLVAGFGFARPVPVNPNAVGRWGMAAVAAAGPISNIILAGLGVLLLQLMPAGNPLNLVLFLFVSINVVLAVFNLLPIPLLDGSRIVSAFFPRTLGRALAEFEQLPYAFLLVLAVIFLGRPYISQIIGAVQSFLFNNLMF